MINLLDSGFEVKAWTSATVQVIRGDLYLIEKGANKEDKIVPREQLRPWTAKVPIRIEDFSIEEVKVCEEFNLAEFIKNSQEIREQEVGEDSQPTL